METVVCRKRADRARSTGDTDELSGNIKTIMRTQLRIVAGSLKGRKVTCTVSETLRPTPQRVREALFSILGNAIPGRPFYDVFAGTGIIGLEAISRGARSVLFVERDFKLAGEIDRHIQAFGVRPKTQMARADVYRWVERWQPPAEPINVFLSPPFADFTTRLEAFMGLVGLIQSKIADESVFVIQGEHEAPLFHLPPNIAEWDDRRYGRNHLFLWVKGSPANAENRPAVTDEEE